MQDKYGVELDLNISKFKSKMNEASKEAEMFGKKVKSSVGQVVNGIDTHYTGPSKLIAKTKEELQQTSTEMNRVSKNSSNVGGTIEKAFTKGLKSVRNLTIGFLGASSVFYLFRQELSTYRTENEFFNQQMMLTSNIITTALAPAFEFFANVIQYATIGLAKIIDIMFGTNISSKVLASGLSKANTQLAEMSGGMNDVSDSAKEMKDNLLGIDEITNLQQEGTGTGLLSGIGGGADLDKLKDQFKALDDFKKKMQEVDAWLSKSGLKGFFQELGKIIKTVGEAIMWTWNKLVESFGSGDFSWVGHALAQGFEYGAKLISKIDWAGLGKRIGEIVSNLILDTDWIELGKSILKLIIRGVTAISEIHFSLIDTAVDELKNHLLKKVGIDGDSIGGKLATSVANGFKSGLKYVTGSLFNPIGTISNVGKKIWQSMFGKANGGIFTGSWQPITAYANGGNPNSGEMFVAREAGPELVGTIGGHSAVMNNDQIVASVSAGVYQAVASAMSGQGNRPIVLNINGKEFAKATYSDYQEETSRRGTNTSIRRV